MSRITHFRIQPKNIQYWDYYILCHLDVYAAIALQRFEYWDGTKSDGNVHAEDINDILESLEEEMTQDTSRFFYKAQDELQWELMGLTGEKYTANLINFLIKDLNYLEQRNNPSNAMDRKKQYLFHDELVQSHVNYLGYVIDYFKRLGFQLNPVYYAIEQLTAAKIYIDTLNIALVVDKLNEMYVQMEEDEAKVKESKKYKPVLPKFIRIQLSKNKGLLPLLKANKLRRFRNFAEWKAQFCGMESAEMQDASCKNAEWNPQECGSNSNNYRQQLQTVTTDRKNEGALISTNPQQRDSFTPSLAHSSSPSVDNSVEKQSETPSLIAKATPPVTSQRNTDELDPTRLVDLLSPEEQRIHSYWQELGFEANITTKLKGHWAKLAKHIKTFEQFKSLYEHTRQQIENNPEIKNKRISPGNLTNDNNLNGWKQWELKQKQSSETKEEKRPKKSALGVSGLPLCMSDPSEPRMPYKFNPGKSRRRVVTK